MTNDEMIRMITEIAAEEYVDRATSTPDAKSIMKKEAVEIVAAIMTTVDRKEAAKVAVEMMDGMYDDERIYRAKILGAVFLLCETVGRMARIEAECFARGFGGVAAAEILKVVRAGKTQVN